MAVTFPKEMYVSIFETRYSIRSRVNSWSAMPRSAFQASIRWTICSAATGCLNIRHNSTCCLEVHRRQKWSSSSSATRRSSFSARPRRTTSYRTECRYFVKQSSLLSHLLVTSNDRQKYRKPQMHSSPRQIFSPTQLLHIYCSAINSTIFEI